MFMQPLSQLTHAKTRSISPENFTGEKGRGGMATEGTGKEAARELGQGWKISPSVMIQPGETFTMADYTGQGRITHIWVTDSAVNRGLVFRMYWDKSETPSVECPLGDFFACSDHETYRQLSSLAVCVNPKRAFNCYWDMPFYTGFKVTIENITAKPCALYYQIDFTEEELPAGLGYFHAQFRRVNPLPYKSVYTILDNVQGHGQYVGTYLYWGVNNCNWWGEGEIKFYMDGDTDFPTVCGTGTEDYFCGSWNFDVNGKYTEFSSPYTGLYKVTAPDGLYRSQQRFSMYRWHITDPIRFEKDLKVTIQALGWREEHRYLPLQDDISSVAYWYQDSISRTFPTLPDRNGLEII